MGEAEGSSSGQVPLPLPASGSGDDLPIPLGATTPQPPRSQGAELNELYANLTSTEPGPGSVQAPRSNQEGLRNLMLPGNEEWMRDINARVAAENGGKGPVSLRFDREGVNAAIRRVEDLVRQVRSAFQDADRMRQVVQRDEKVSARYAYVANDAGRAYVEYLRKTEKELRDFLDDLEQIRDRYAAQDEDMASGYEKTETS